MFGEEPLPDDTRFCPSTTWSSRRTSARPPRPHRRTSPSRRPTKWSPRPRPTRRQRAERAVAGRGDVRRPGRTSTSRTCRSQRVASAASCPKAVTYTGDIAEDDELVTASALKGVFAPLEWQVNAVNAPQVAKERGIEVVESKSRQSDDFQSLVTVTVRDGEESVSVCGTQFGGEEPRIVRIDGHRLDAIPYGQMLVARNYDKPGVIGFIGTVLGENDVNIAGMFNGRATAGGEALTVYNLDDDVPQRPRAAPRRRAASSTSTYVELGDETQRNLLTGSSAFQSPWSKPALAPVDDGLPMFAFLFDAVSSVATCERNSAICIADRTGCLSGRRSGSPTGPRLERRRDSRDAPYPRQERHGRNHPSTAVTRSSVAREVRRRSLSPTPNSAASVIGASASFARRPVVGEISAVTVQYPLRQPQPQSGAVSSALSACRRTTPPARVRAIPGRCR